MCGIVVSLEKKSQIDIPLLEAARMSAKIKHRGPDGDGIYISIGTILKKSLMTLIVLQKKRNQTVRAQNQNLQENRQKCLWHTGDWPY